MARRQRHLLHFAGVPGRNDMAAAFGVPFDLRNPLIDLVDRSSIRCAPIAPLRAVNAAQIAVRIGPLIPNRDTMILQIFDVRLAAQEPEQFVNDRFQMKLLGGQEWETFPQRKSRLRAEHRVGSCSGSIPLKLPLLQNESQQIQVLNHDQNMFRPRDPTPDISKTPNDASTYSHHGAALNTDSSKSEETSVTLKVRTTIPF